MHKKMFPALLGVALLSGVPAQAEQIQKLEHVRQQALLRDYCIAMKVTECHKTWFWSVSLQCPKAEEHVVAVSCAINIWNENPKLLVNSPFPYDGDSQSSRGVCAWRLDHPPVDQSGKVNTSGTIDLICAE